MCSSDLSAEQLSQDLGKLIQHLHWKDFETLVDLIFSGSGWKRLGVLGEVEKTLDLDLVSPVTGERVMVQIKSESNINEFNSYKEQFDAMEEFNKLFYVVHTPSDNLKKDSVDDENVKLLVLDDISQLAVRTGLAEWVIKKAS